MELAGTTSCRWCGRPWDDRAERLSGRTRCPQCGVAVTDPWPSPEELARAYAGSYRPESGRFGTFGDRLFSKLRGGLARRLVKIAPEGPILDVGAGDGTLVDALKKAGRDALGLDPYSARQDFISAPVSELEEGRWAGIVLWHSLEHMPDPVGTLRACTRALQPGGVMVVAIPNAASLQAHHCGDLWLALDLPRHLFHIPGQALLGTLRRFGLQTSRVSYWRGGQVVFGWLHCLVKRVSGLDLYDAIRAPEARSEPLSTGARALALTLGALLLPVALLDSAREILVRRGGSIYVEARRT